MKTKSLWTSLQGQAQISPVSPVKKQEGFRQGDSFYCLPEAFKTEVIKGYSLKKALGVLGDAGWLQRKGGKNLIVERLPSLGPKRVYVLTLPPES